MALYNTAIMDKNLFHLFSAMGFKASDKSNVVYEKEYHDSSRITVNFQEKRICYSDNIRIDR